MRRIAVEIGGTKLQAALGRGDGTIERLERVRANAEAGSEAIREQIADLVNRLRTSGDVERVAIGFGGPVNVVTGCVIISHQVSGWSGFALREWAEKRFGLPCILENDSNCAGLAEGLIGAGAGARTTFYMNVGSGIGGAFVVDGKLYSTQVGAGEIGHTYVWDASKGEYAILESVCSGWAMQRRARELASRGGAAAMLKLAGGEVNRIDGEVVGRALAKGDSVAAELVSDVCRGLSVALANVIALLNPERIVIGGGVSLMGEPFMNLLREELSGRIFGPFRGCQQVVPAALGEQVVVAGALLL